MKALSHSFASRAQTFGFEGVRWCAPPDPDDAARISDSCSRAKDPRHSDSALRFPKTAKLLRHADFQRVYKQGRRHFAAHMTVFYLRRDVARPPSGGNGPRVGLTVGRVLGGAVERNRIKRRLREAVRHNLGTLPGGVDVVINPKKSALTAEFVILHNEVARAFQVIGEKART